MSSLSVRQAIKSAVEAAAAPLSVFDLSNYASMKDALPDDESKAVLLQYVVADDRVRSIGGQGNQGWEESGTVALHLVVPFGFDSAADVALGDTIRLALRGSRLSESLVIESCEPFTDFGGALGKYPGNRKGWVANLYYENRNCG